MLSVIIPARNEAYLERTIKNILENARGEIEILVMLDGYLPDPPIDTKDPRVIFHHFSESIGQRQCINAGAKIAKGKYVMKLDAHCAVDEGFDVKLAADCEYNWTIVPRMYNLDHVTWKPKLHKRTDYMYIGCDEGRLLRAEYYGGRQSKNSTEIDDTMCCMGPGWFMHKDRYWELGGMDEGHGGWGQMGVEIGCKAWLSGGALKVNKKTWFAHWFRGGGGPGFPYKISGKAVEHARKYSRDLWINNKWEKATHNFAWLIDKFNPPGWDKQVQDLTILFYTANVVSKNIIEPVIRSLKRHNIPIISISQEPMDFGTNIVTPKKRSLQNIYRQVLEGAKKATTKYVALCEDDCLYVPEHFQYRPKSTPFAYNLNRWLLHIDEKVFSYRERPILSQCIANREELIKNLEERFKLPAIPDKYCGEMGCFEKQLGMTECTYETCRTKDPNLVVCHDKNTSGRKYLGKDAEPKTELAPWGNVDYWVKKFSDHTPKSRIRAKTNKQHSHIGSVILDVEDMYAHRMDYVDPAKVQGLRDFMEVFPPFLKFVMENDREYINEELLSFKYFNYLIERLNPADREPLTNKGKRHCFALMRDVAKLYKDIKENGLRNPLDLWREGDRFVLHRGGRRLEILHALGYGKVPCRVFKTKNLFRKLAPGKAIEEDNSIHSLAMKQFQKLKEKSTDKYWVHTYTRLYDRHVGYMRQDAEKILELGVFRGASLLLWKDAFPHAHIYGVDHKTRPDTLLDKDDRITFLLGSQQDIKFLNNGVVGGGPYDMIVDDAGHRPLEMMESFKVLWDSVKPNGWYVIEDLYGNYRSDRIKDTMMAPLKDMIDEMNINCTIREMHFYYNICFIQKR